MFIRRSKSCEDCVSHKQKTRREVQQYDGVETPDQILLSERVGQRKSRQLPLGGDILTKTESTKNNDAR